MKKNVLLLLFILPVLFGCSSDYDILIYNDKVVENVNITSSATSESITRVENELKYPTPAFFSQKFDGNTQTKVDGVSYYKKTKIESGGNIGISYNYEYDLSNYHDSTLANSCYDKFNVLDKGDKYTISTDFKNNCILNGVTNEVKVHLKTNHKVISNNADEVDKYDYYWTVNKSNYNKKSIFIEIYKDKYVLNYEGRLTKILIASLFLAFFAVIVIIFFRKRTINNNKI